MRKIGLVFVCVFLLGCSTMGNEILQENVAQIKEGVTTEQEVIALFGKPTTKTLTAEGKILTNYFYTKATSKASSFIPVVGLVAGGTNMRQQSLSIIFDENGVVEKYTTLDTENEMKTGIF